MMNQLNRRGNTTYGYALSHKKTAGPKTDIQQRALGYNPNRPQNRLPNSKGGYFRAETPNEAPKTVFNLFRSPSNCANRRPNSVTRVPETHVNEAYYTKIAHQNVATKDENYEIHQNVVLRNDVERGRKTQAPPHVSTVSRTSYCPRSMSAVADKDKENTYDDSDTILKDNTVYPVEVSDSQFSVERNYTSNRNLQSVGNKIVYFGKQSPMPQKQPLEISSKHASRTSSPYNRASTADIVPRLSTKPLRDLSKENKNSSTNAGCYTIPSQRCLSYRLGAKLTPHVDISSEVAAKIDDNLSSTTCSNKQNSGCFQSSLKNNTVNNEEYRREQYKNNDECRSGKASRASSATRTNNLFNQLVAASTNSNINTTPKPSPAAKIIKNPPEKKLSSLHTLSFSNKGGYIDSKMNLENYRLDKILGQGSYATVRLAFDKETNERVAIKTYEKFKLHDAQRRKNVQREIEILQALNHPNVIKLHKTIDTISQIHLVMEFVGMQSLHSYLKTKSSRRLPEMDAKKIFRQIVLALDYLHVNNIAHRDMKLENILLDSNMNVKIIDFGFSLETCPNKTLDTFCGTPSYMAPELAAKRNYHGNHTDIWAAGIILYVLLAGYFPFKDINEKDLFRKISRGHYDMPSSFSEDAKALLKKMLRMNPLERPSAAEILQDKWITGLQAHNTNLKNYLNLKIQQYKSEQQEHAAKLVEVV